MKVTLQLQLFGLFNLRLMICRWLIKPLLETKSPDVPHWDPQSSCLKILKKTLHRFLRLLFKGQLFQMVPNASLDQNICFIYADKANIGDAIMDLACITLLRNELDGKYEINLIAHKDIFPVFSCDPRFSHVVSADNSDEARSLNADICVMFLLDYKSIDTKARLFPKLPLLVLHNWFAGDRNPMLHGASSLSKCFNLSMGPQNAVKCVRQFFSPCATGSSESLRTIEDFRRLYPSIVGVLVGGIDPNRTYGHWIKVLTSFRDRNVGFLLLGSSNGVEEANTIHRSFDGINVMSKVGDLSLGDFKSAVETCDVIVCPDGGGMHMSLGCETKMVVLFGNESPDSRLPVSFDGLALHAKGEVSNIQPSLIVDAIDNLL